MGVLKNGGSRSFSLNINRNREFGSSEQTLELILSLLSVLSHKIRTPLSVISNDLTYFQSLLGAGECERGIAKCHNISSFFKPAEMLLIPRGQAERFDLFDLLSTLPTKCPQTTPVSLLICGIRQNLVQALRWIIDLFPVEKLELLDGSRLLSFSVESSLWHEEPVLIDLGETTITEIYGLNPTDESILPILIDAVLISYAAKPRITGKNEFTIEFGEKLG